MIVSQIHTLQSETHGEACGHLMTFVVSSFVLIQEVCEVRGDSVAGHAFVHWQTPPLDERRVRIAGGCEQCSQAAACGPAGQSRRMRAPFNFEASDSD